MMAGVVSVSNRDAPNTALRYVVSRIRQLNPRQAERRRRHVRLAVAACDRYGRMRVGVDHQSLDPVVAAIQVGNDSPIRADQAEAGREGARGGIDRKLLRPGQAEWQLDPNPLAVAPGRDERLIEGGRDPR